MKTSQFTLIIIGLAASMPFPLPATAHDHDSMVVIRDDCEPNDPGYAPTGGCLRKEGDVSFAEFGVEQSSPLAPTSVIGHQAWRMDPPYIKLDTDDSLMVRNRGGSTRPGRAPVGFPSRQTTAPLTIAVSMPFAG